jgi:L-ascorbate metabolism protein UlaG (beta-lactamase superfamily)
MESFDMRSVNRKAVEACFLLALCTSLQADVTITRLANAGVIISDGEARVMIDGMVVEPYAVYGGLPETAIADYTSASGDFAGIDLALVSHRHHEHNQPAFACTFLKASRATEFYASEQVVGLVREFCRELVTTSGRVHTIDPQYGLPHVIELEGVRVTVFPLTHGTKYARIKNFAHLVEIGGMKVLHVGDAAFEPADFEKSGLADVKLDIALIPIAYFQPGPGSEIIERFMNAPVKIAMHIPPGELEEIKGLVAPDHPQLIFLDEPLQQLRFSAAAPPPPQPEQ